MRRPGNHKGFACARSTRSISMAKFVFAYTGGNPPQTEAEGEAVMAAWMGWFGTLGAAIIDGGNPFGASQSVASDGSTREGNVTNLTGYSIIDAADITAATELAKGCPALASGGTVDVFEAMAI